MITVSLESPPYWNRLSFDFLFVLLSWLYPVILNLSSIILKIFFLSIYCIILLKFSNYLSSWFERYHHLPLLLIVFYDESRVFCFLDPSPAVALLNDICISTAGRSVFLMLLLLPASLWWALRPERSGTLSRLQEW